MLGFKGTRVYHEDIDAHVYDSAIPPKNFATTEDDSLPAPPGLSLGAISPAWWGDRKSLCHPSAKSQRYSQPRAGYS